MNNSIIRLNASPPGFGAVADAIAEGVLGSPVQHTYEFFSDDELGLYVGVWDTTDMLEPAEPYSMDEFMLVIEGKAIIKDNRRDTCTTINAGESFAIPKGYDCQWEQQGYLRKFFFISCHPDEPVPSRPSYDGVVLPKINQATLKPADSNPFLTDDTSKTEYTDTLGKFQVNTWMLEPFETQARLFPRYQLFAVQAGSLELVDEQQTHHHFAAGDVFFIPQGTQCAANAIQSVTLISASLSA